MKAIIILLFGVAFSAYASDEFQVGGAKGEFSIAHQNMTFDFEPTTSIYILRSLNTKVSGQLVSSGIFAKFAPTYDGTFVQVPGHQIAGAVTVSLTLTEGQPTLEVFIEIDDMVQGYRAQSSAKYTVHVEIIEGTWEDFQNGATIRLRTRPETDIAFAEAMKAGLGTLLNNATSNGIENLSIASTVNEVRLLSPIELTANSKQIVVKQVDSLYSVTIEVGL